MEYDLPHRIDILLATDAADALDAADHDHPVFDDLTDVLGETELHQTEEGVTVRHRLDAIVSADGMRVLAEVADEDGDDLAAVCHALGTVAEPDTAGTMVGEIRDGASREVHAFDPEFDPFEATAEVTSDDIEAAEQVNDAMEEFINDLR